MQFKQNKKFKRNWLFSFLFFFLVVMNQNCGGKFNSVTDALSNASGDLGATPTATPGLTPTPVPTPMPTPVSGRELFISPTGNDSTGDGSFAKPYKTIMRVLNTSTGVALPGDTITLRGPAGNNTYNECNVRLRKPLTIRSYPGERAHIHCDINTPDSVTVEIDYQASGSKLSNLEISGGQYYGVMMQTNWYYGGSGPDNVGATNIILEDLYIHHTGRDAVKVTPKCDHITIRRSEIAFSGAIYPPGTILDDRNAEGIDNVNGSYMVVEDSYIHDTSTTGLYFKGGAHDVLVQRNRIENTGLAGILVGFDTSVEFFDLTENPHYYEAVRGVVRNNVIRNTAYAGIGLYGSKDSVVANNTIINAATEGHAGIYFGTPLQDWDDNAERPSNLGNVIRNNLVIQNGRDCVGIRYFDELGGVSGLAGNPDMNYNGFYNTAGACNFVDGRPGSSLNGGGNFAQWKAAEHADANSIVAAFSVDANGHLPAGSPAIDKGINLPQVIDDIDGQSRSGLYDIGADEK